MCDSLFMEVKVNPGVRILHGALAMLVLPTVHTDEMCTTKIYPVTQTRELLDAANGTSFILNTNHSGHSMMAFKYTTFVIHSM